MTPGELASIAYWCGVTPDLRTAIRQWYVWQAERRTPPPPDDAELNDAACVPAPGSRLLDDILASMAEPATASDLSSWSDTSGRRRGTPAPSTGCWSESEKIVLRLPFPLRGQTGPLRHRGRS